MWFLLKYNKQLVFLSLFPRSTQKQRRGWSFSALKFVCSTVQLHSRKRHTGQPSTHANWANCSAKQTRNKHHRWAEQMNQNHAHKLSPPGRAWGGDGGKLSSEEEWAARESGPHRVILVHFTQHSYNPRTNCKRAQTLRHLYTDVNHKGLNLSTCKTWLDLPTAKVSPHDCLSPPLTLVSFWLFQWRHQVESAAWAGCGWFVLELQQGSDIWLEPEQMVGYRCWNHRRQSSAQSMWHRNLWMLLCQTTIPVPLSWLDVIVLSENKIQSKKFFPPCQKPCCLACFSVLAFFRQKTLLLTNQPQNTL